MSKFVCNGNNTLSDKKLIDELINVIINGEIDEFRMRGGIHEKYNKCIYDELSKYPDNANCLYHLGLLILNWHKKLGIDKNVYIKYLEKAVELNHPTALFTLGFKYFNNDKSNKRSEAIELGTNAFLKGYDNIIRSCSEYYDTIYRNECMLMAITRLREQNRKLEIKNKKLKDHNFTLNVEFEKEKLRPPEQGGSEYEHIKHHFEILKDNV